MGLISTTSAWLQTVGTTACLAVRVPTGWLGRLGTALFGGEGDDTMYGDDLGVYGRRRLGPGPRCMATPTPAKMYMAAPRKTCWTEARAMTSSMAKRATTLCWATLETAMRGQRWRGHPGWRRRADRLLGGEDDDQLWRPGARMNTLDRRRRGPDPPAAGRTARSSSLGGAGGDTYLFEAGDDAGVVSTHTGSRSNNTVQLTRVAPQGHAT